MIELMKDFFPYRILEEIEVVHRITLELGASSAEFHCEIVGDIAKRFVAS